MEKKRNLWVIPTDKPSRLFDDGIELYLGELKDRKGHPVTSYNIYITSDEYIGLSYYLDGDLVRKGVVDDKDYWKVRKDYKKIILTTDQDLIKDGVQAIDDEFLEWFVKNPSCEEVEVEEFEPIYGHQNNSSSVLYKTIIPKEEPKERLKKILGTKHPKQESFVERMKPLQEQWQQDMDKELMKQETLEEAAEKFRSENPGTMQGGNNTKILNAFKNGAKWNQERSYSEEEVLELLQKALTHQDDGETGSLVTAQGKIRTANFFSWFEKFKKK